MTTAALPPKVSMWADTYGAVVIRTHDPEIARAAVRTYLTEERGLTADDLLEVAWWLDDEPTIEYGRWAFCGIASVEERAQAWNVCEGPGPGISRAVVWHEP